MGSKIFFASIWGLFFCFACFAYFPFHYQHQLLSQTHHKIGTCAAYLAPTLVLPIVLEDLALQPALDDVEYLRLIVEQSLAHLLQQPLVFLPLPLHNNVENTSLLTILSSS